MPVLFCLAGVWLPCRSAPDVAAAVSCPPAEAVLACARAAAVPSLLLAAAGTRRELLHAAARVLAALASAGLAGAQVSLLLRAAPFAVLWPAVAALLPAAPAEPELRLRNSQRCLLLRAVLLRPAAEAPGMRRHRPCLSLLLLLLPPLPSLLLLLGLLPLCVGVFARGCAATHLNRFEPSIGERCAGEHIKATMNML